MLVSISRPWFFVYTSPQGGSAAAAWTSAPLRWYSGLTPYEWCPAIYGSDGKPPFQCVLPVAGVGYKQIESKITFTLCNVGDVDAECGVGIGITNTVQNDPTGRPMPPYTGWSHDRADWGEDRFTVPAGMSVKVGSLFRQDIVNLDDLTAWKLIKGAADPTNYPALIGSAGVLTVDAKVVVKGIQFWSQELR